MNLEKRLRALEAELRTDPVVLLMADGSTRQLRGDGYIRRLFGGAFGNKEPDSEVAAELDLVRQSVDWKEPGGAHMVELLWALLNSPVEGPDVSAGTIR